MTIAERAQHTATALLSVLQATPSDEQREELLRLLEHAFVNCVLEEGERCTHVVMQCCSADLDLAHKTAETIRRNNEALVANLSSLR